VDKRRPALDPDKDCTRHGRADDAELPRARSHVEHARGRTADKQLRRPCRYRDGCPERRGHGTHRRRIHFVELRIDDSSFPEPLRKRDPPIGVAGLMMGLPFRCDFEGTNVGDEGARPRRSLYGLQTAPLRAQQTTPSGQSATIGFLMRSAARTSGAESIFCSIVETAGASRRLGYPLA
jgi:hypothetical protein